jgi:hypothetical protein
MSASGAATKAASKVARAPRLTVLVLAEAGVTRTPRAGTLKVVVRVEAAGVIKALAIAVRVEAGVIKALAIVVRVEDGATRTLAAGATRTLAAGARARTVAANRKRKDQ